MNVKTVADQLCDSEAVLASPSHPVQPLIEYGRLPEFVALTKPRVMMLAVFTALVGLISAPVRLELFVAFIAVLAIAAGAGSAGVLNMWYDADIDAVMTRTAMRPIPRGKVSRSEALVFGLALAVAAVMDGSIDEGEKSALREIIEQRISEAQNRAAQEVIASL